MTDLNGTVSFGGGGGGSDRQERRNSFHQNRNANRNRNTGGGVTVDLGTRNDAVRGVVGLLGAKKGGVGGNESGGVYCPDCSFTIPNSGPR